MIEIESGWVSLALSITLLLAIVGCLVIVSIVDEYRQERVSVSYIVRISILYSASAGTVIGGAWSTALEHVRIVLP